jgi:hypothetical protein
MVRLKYPVKDAFPLNDSTIIVLYEPDALLGTGGQFRNLVAITNAGEEIWHAELPTNQNADVYTAIYSREPLLAFSWTSFQCRIDETTGRLLSKEFLK